MIASTPSDFKPILFITGLGRSGSRLLLETLSINGLHCPISSIKDQSDSIWELAELNEANTFVEPYWEQVPVSFDSINSLSKEPARQEQIRTVVKAAAAEGESKVLALKDPRIFFLTRLYRKIFPEAVFIHVYRNPYAYALSEMEEKKHYKKTIHCLEFWLRYWDSMMEYWNTQADSRPGFEAICFESLMNNFDDTFRELLSRLGLVDQGKRPRLRQSRFRIEEIKNAKSNSNWHPPSAKKWGYE